MAVEKCQDISSLRKDVLNRYLRHEAAPIYDVCVLLCNVPLFLNTMWYVSHVNLKL